MTRALGWMDVVSTDLTAMAQFYRSVFGWTVTESFDHHGGEYRMLQHGDHYAAGIEQIAPEKGPARWTVFVVSDDMAGTVDAALAAGGAVTFQPEALHDLGIVAMITDPLGATLGVWQPGTFDPRGIPEFDGRFAGAELVTSDVERTRAFLTAVVEPDVGVVTAGEQGEWRPVLGVAELDSAVAAVSSAGATTSTRTDGLVEVVDPLGAAFLLVQR